MNGTEQIHKSKTITRKCCHETLDICQTIAMKSRKLEKGKFSEAFVFLWRSSGKEWRNMVDDGT